MRNLLSLLTLGVSLSLAGAGLVSCEPQDYFGDYEGLNLIKDYPFDPAAGTPQWVIDYGASVAPVNYADYMTAAAVTAGVEFPNTTGLPSGTADFTRLEIHNLAQNGDFEGGTTGWSTLSGAPTVAVNNTDLHTIDGNTLVFDMSGTDRYAYDIDDGMSNAAAASAYEENAYYTFRGDFRHAATLRFEYSDETTNLANPWEIALGANPQWQSAATPRTFASSGINNTVTMAAAPTAFLIGSFKSPGNNNGTLDNFRILRSDITPVYQLDIPQSIPGMPDLISGYYRFTCYYKIEEDSQVTPNVVNSFRGGNLNLVIQSLDAGTPQSQTSTEPLSLRGTSPGGWESYRAEGFLIIHKQDNSSDPVLRLTISPTDPTGDNDIGRLLIAAPKLEYSAVPWE